MSVTVKAYDVLPYTSYDFAYNTTADSDTFWTMVASFHSQVPRLVKSGLMGYFWVTPFDSLETNATIQGKVYGEWLAPKMSVNQVRQHLAPLEEYIKSADLGDAVFVSGNGEEFPDYTKGYAEINNPDTAGIPVRLGSRLLDEKALSKPISELKSRFAQSERSIWSLAYIGSRHCRPRHHVAQRRYRRWVRCSTASVEKGLYADG